MQPLNLAVIETPQHLPGRVSTEAYVEGFAWCIELLPNGLEILVWRHRLVVIIGDGVTDHQQLRVGMSLHGVVAVKPPRFALWRGNDRRILGGAFRCRPRGAGSSKSCGKDKNRPHDERFEGRVAKYPSHAITPFSVLLRIHMARGKPIVTVRWPTCLTSCMSGSGTSIASVRSPKNPVPLERPSVSGL